MLIVTGMSGAGRSTVGNALEDLGWYVVDNLPPQMLRPLVDLVEHAGERAARGRGGRRHPRRRLLRRLQDIIQVAARQGVNVRVLFLDATDAALVRRFEQVRRPHPLQGDGTLLDGISAERARLRELREASDIVIDTSDLNIHQLATLITETFADEGTPDLRVTMLSFGFKYGLPADADLVADCRFLPNPFWSPSCGTSPARTRRCASTCSASPAPRSSSTPTRRRSSPCWPGYQRENKRHATIAIGCTGGKHRSVAIVEELGDRLAQIPGVAVSVKHRDLGRE